MSTEPEEQQNGTDTHRQEPDSDAGTGDAGPLNTGGNAVRPPDEARTRGAGVDADRPAEGRDEPQEPTASDYEAMPFDDLWSTLTDNQKRYVLARQSTSTKAAAAERIGIHRDTAYQWPAYVGIAVSRLVDHRKDAIREGLSDAAVRATQRLTELLDDDDSRTAIKAVQFALEQEIGKATQKQEIQHSGSVGITDEEVEDFASALDHLGGN